MTPRRVLITGGVGFIGSHLVEDLLHQGYSVRVLDNLSPQVHGKGHCLPSYFPEEAGFVFGDVCDRRVLEHALRGVDIVFHLAAETGVGQSMYEAQSYTRTNVSGTASLWDAIHAVGDVQKVVIASSRAVYGEGTYRCPNCGRVRPQVRDDKDLSQGRWKPMCPNCHGSIRPIPTSESDSLQPVSVYGITKLAQEQLSLTLGHSYGIQVVVLRFFNVYGSRQALSNPYTGILATFAARLRSRKPLLIYEDGEQLRDFVHVRDVVNACELSLSYGASDYAVFNVGTGEPVSVLQLAQRVQSLTDSNPEATESRSSKVTGYYRSGDIRDCYADVARARAELGYKPSISLEDGLRAFLKWAESQPLTDRTDEASRELESAGLLGEACS
jgi:dTDP-L-rhamnose 4-epimerase